MKNILVKIAAASMLVAPLAYAFPAQAALTPTWDVTGNYVIAYTCGFGCGGTYPHDLAVTQDSSGSLTGSDGYPVGGPYVYTQVLTSGSVVGSTIDYYSNYTASADAVTPQTTTHVTGTIAADGTMSGAWTDNYQGGFRGGPWSTTSGAAHVSVVADWGSVLSAAACTNKIGSPVINVTEKVVNDIDSGVHGNYWAYDNFNRHIQVWHTLTKDGTTFCALVTYEGKSTTVAGDSPNGTGHVDAGIVAQLKGGYRADITGTLKASPLGWPTKGSVGTVDYKCDAGTGNCQNPVSWVDQYFTGSTFSYDWWGWFYQTVSNGSWVNSSEGNWGDIL
jgi:hypothetical protein